MKKVSGVVENISGKGLKIGIVTSRFNHDITSALLEGARRILLRAGVKKSSIIEVWVPGAFELPLAAQALIQKEKLDAVIALACVVQGDTPHFDYVCEGVTNGIMQVNLTTGVPVIFGVLTTHTMEQALERVGGTHQPHVGHKGEEAAWTALEMGRAYGK